MRATVLVPTHDHASTLDLAVASALGQTVANIEVIVIGDGVGDDTRDVATELVQGDDRVQFVDRPKGLRHGEKYRDEVLAQARGRIVCYLSDDDLWLTEHIEEMDELLCSADFAHGLPVTVSPDGGLETPAIDLREAYWRDRVLKVENRVPLSCGAHTLDAYRRLPVGWEPAPLNVPSDLYFWRRLLDHPDFRFVSSAKPTVLHFPSPQRSDATGAQRRVELEAWSHRVGDGVGRALWREAVHAHVEMDRARSEAHRIALVELANDLEARLRSVDGERAETQTRYEAMHQLATNRQDQLTELAPKLEQARAALKETLSALDATRSTVTWRAHDWLFRQRFIGQVPRAIGAQRARRAAPRTGPQ